MSQLIKIPLKRVGRPKDISGVVIFLCSEDSDYIAGETIIVDGERSIKW